MCFNHRWAQCIKMPSMHYFSSALKAKYTNSTQLMDNDGFEKFHFYLLDSEKQNFSFLNHFFNFLMQENVNALRHFNALCPSMLKS